VIPKVNTPRWGSKAHLETLLATGTVTGVPKSISASWFASVPSRQSSIMECLTAIRVVRTFLGKFEFEFEFILRLADSRPVRSGIEPPFGTLDQILSCSSFFRLTNT
jgi:hypothetical protein